MEKEFECIEERILVEHNNTRARLYKHKKTGAEILSCCNDDENKVFSINFRTPPHDSTGVAHILEHSVLCGSHKYPTKEPFVELLKSSLQTFLNAFTYPDKTCYPVASTNCKDFYNLMDVYADAVFHPLITESIFKQEGWHIEATDLNTPISFKGVVYNEMKGVYSSADSLFAEIIQHSMFPNTPYSVDSGGEPNTILQLTYEQFLAFHKDYYHPSNARFFFWGDDDESIRLEKIALLLKDYSARSIDSAIPFQSPFEQPQYYERNYESSFDEDASFIACNFLLPETIHAELVFAFEVIEFILLGMPGSPLRKALIESGLGTDITGGGLHTDLRQMYFSIGLKGVAKGNVDKVEACIFETISKIVEDGIPDDLLEAALTSIEFELRENNTSRYPVGLGQMVRCLTTWLYDSSPFILLEYNKPFQSVKNKPKEYFTILLRTYFLQNLSRSTVILHPDSTLQDKRSMAEKEHIERLEAQLTKEEKQQIIEDTKLLIEQQGQPDPPEALARIPKLTLTDISRKEKDIDLQIDGIFAIAPLPTSGIAYVDMYFSLSSVPLALYPLLPLFSRALLEMGTKSKSYVELGIAISCSLGDIDCSPTFLLKTDTVTVHRYFTVEMKALYTKLNTAKDIVIDILSNPDFNNKERFLQIVLEEKARLEHSIIPAGHSFVLTRMGLHQTTIGQYDEATSGISYLSYIRTLERRIHADFNSVKNDLELLYNSILKQSAEHINIICEASAIDCARSYASALNTALPILEQNVVEHTFTPLSNVKEAFISQSQVNYMAKGLNIYEHGIEYHPCYAVACKYLRMGYLWEKVRVQGGAYGVFVLCNQYTGLLAFASYRDPNTERTLSVFDAAANEIVQHDFTDKEIESLCIATLGDRDTYLLADAKGRQAFIRYLLDNSLEKRQQEREQIFATTKQDIQKIAEALTMVKTHGSIVGLGGKELERFASSQQGYIIHHIDNYEI